MGLASWAVPRALQHKRVATWQGYARAAASGDNRNTQLGMLARLCKANTPATVAHLAAFPTSALSSSGQCNPLLQKLARNASLIP